MGKSEKTKINVKDRIDDITIDLSLSDVSEIPVNEIAKFKRATILDLSSNKILTLGKNFGSLTHLTKLDLSKNQLKFLPEDISKLTNLRHLDLYNNKLEHLPLGFGNLKNLRYLDLKGNPLTPALAKIVGPCLTQKECQTAARTTVKFFGEMQKSVEEEQQRAREEQLQSEEAEKEKERIEAVKEKSKGKPKRDKKKEPKQRLIREPIIEDFDRSLLVEDDDDEPKKVTIPYRRLLFYSFALWMFFALGVVFVIARSPHMITDLIVERLPESYHAPLLYHLQNIQKEISKYLK